MKSNSRGARFRRGLLLLFIAVIGGFAAWMIYENATEPRYNGKTARQWYMQHLKWEGSHRDFISALGPLNAQFASMLGRELKRSGSPLDAFYVKTYQKLPKSISRFISPPMDPAVRRDQASLTLMNLLLAYPDIAPTVAQDLPVFEKLMAAPNNDRILYLIYSAAGNDPKLMRKTENLTNSNFWVRYAAATYLQSYELSRPNVDVTQYSNAIPVCVETITNADTLEKQYGVKMEFYRRRALSVLTAISPQTAALYADQVKEDRR